MIAIWATVFASLLSLPVGLNGQEDGEPEVASTIRCYAGCIKPLVEAGLLNPLISADRIDITKEYVVNFYDESCRAVNITRSCITVCRQHKYVLTGLRNSGLLSMCEDPTSQIESTLKCQGENHGRVLKRCNETRLKEYQKTADQLAEMMASVAEDPRFLFKSSLRNWAGNFCERTARVGVCISSVYRRNCEVNDYAKFRTMFKRAFSFIRPEHLAFVHRECRKMAYLFLQIVNQRLEGSSLN